MKRAHSSSPPVVLNESFPALAAESVMEDSPGAFLTPPTSPSCDTLPQTPTPKKRSPFRPSLDLEPKDWIAELPSAGAGEFCEDSEGCQPVSPASQPQHPQPDENAEDQAIHHLLQHHQEQQQQQRQEQQHRPAPSHSAAPPPTPNRSYGVPVFNGSFLSDPEDMAFAMAAPNAVTGKKNHYNNNNISSSNNNNNESLSIPQKSALETSLKSPRVRGLNFGGNGAEGDLMEINYSNISALPKQHPVPNLNLSLPARAGAAKSPARSNARSPRIAHSTSLLVTHPGPSLGDEDASMNFLKTRQPLLKTPRGVAMNPFQSSPKSTLGSAKKKSRMGLQNGQSRYMQDFEERQKIGSGFFSEVYECQHRMDGMTYAIKVLKEELTAPRLTKKMSEVFALAALPAHENLIRYYSCWTENNRLYIQTELCEGGNLMDKLLKDRYTEEQLLDVLCQVLAGLAHIHKGGLCHLDIKPENILVTYVKNGVARKPVYKIGDLGLVMKSDLTGSFHQDVEGGDGRYMSPELMQGIPEHLAGNLEKSDIWSLGCTVYALARRRDLPVGGDEYAEIRVGRIHLPENEYSPEFVELLRKMIHPDVHARLNAAQLLSHPLLQTRDAREHLVTKIKKRKLKEEVARKDKELVQLQLELQMAREREQHLARELARVQELNSNSMEQKLTEMYALMQKSLSIQK